MPKLTKVQLKEMADQLTVEQVADLLAHIALRTSKDFMENAYEQGDFDPNPNLDGPLTAEKIADDAGNWVYECWFHRGELSTKVERRISALKSQYKPAKK